MSALQTGDRRELEREKTELEARVEALQQDYLRSRARIEELDAERLQLEETRAEIQRQVEERVKRLEIVRGQAEEAERKREEAKARLAEITAEMPRVTTRLERDEMERLCERFGTFTAPDIAAAMRLTPGKALKQIRKLVEKGVLRETGTKVFGKPQFEHVGAAQEEKEAEHEAHVDVVRWVVKTTKAFSPADVERATEVGGHVLTESLQAMLKKGSIEYVGFDDLELYQYVPPTEPGAAAEKDMHRRRTLAKQAIASNGHAGGGAVEGTGAKWKISDPDVRATVEMVERAGGNVRPTAGGHYEVSSPHTRKTIRISGTPGNRRSVLNDRARIRRDLGLEI